MLSAVLQKKSILSRAVVMPSPGPPDFEDDPYSEIEQRIRHPSHMMVHKHMFEKVDTFHHNLLILSQPSQEKCNQFSHQESRQEMAKN
jgi:hypothetical protein